MAQNEKEYSDFHALLQRIKLKEVMKSPVACVYEDDDLSKVEESFVKNNTYYLPVISHDKRLVGLISRKYLYKTQSPRQVVDQYDVQVQYDPDLIMDGNSFYSKETLNSFILRNVMQRDPLVLKEIDTLRDAVLRMDAMKAGCIIIVDNDQQVRGIFSSQEIVRFLSRL